MASIHQEHVVITVSRLVKDGESLQPLVTDELQETLAEVVQTLVGTDAVAEIARGE